MITMTTIMVFGIAEDNNDDDEADEYVNTSRYASALQVACSTRQGCAWHKRRAAVLLFSVGITWRFQNQRVG